MSLSILRRDLKHVSDPVRAPLVARFFKEKNPGEIFYGARVPDCRIIAKQYAALPEQNIATLLASTIHEERFIALLILIHQFEKGDKKAQAHIYRFYLANAQYVNNWDLVDVSAHKIVGTYLLDKKRTVLDNMARSSHLWTRRIAIVATFAFIRQGETEDTFRIARILQNDRQDLIHKATGWMLREAGKKDLPGLRAFLAAHAPHMPRTMLRYAIERMTPAERKQWMTL